jgi:iron complex outermembrane receptor protein
LWDASANLTGQLFDLPAGPVGVALGYEHRDMKGSFVPDAIIQAGLGADIPAAASSGQYHADEVYGELSVPILKDVPFFEQLNGSFAARYSKYSVGGSKATFKAGADWKPTRDLLLRGTWAQGFRAPSIAELFGSRSRYDDVAIDPCNDVAAGSSPASLVSACGAAHVATDGSYEQNNNQLPVFTIGNRNLKAETSRSLVGGAVYSASWASAWAKTLTLEASYFNIRVKNAIGTIDTTSRLNGCYVGGDQSSCALITRSASGQITAIDGTLLNLDSLKTDGLDLNLNYRSPTGPAGSFGLSSFNTLLFHYDQKAPSEAGDGGTLKRAGTVISNQAYPKLKSTTTASWTIGGFTAGLTGRYISGVTEVGGNNPGHRDGRRLYGDIQLIWDTMLAARNFTFTVGVNNIAGTTPPACSACLLNNYDPGTYDVPGQFVYVRVGVKL